MLGVHVPYKSRFETIQDLNDQTIAISKEASGSHLMSYVMAHQNQLKSENMKFNVVGDVYGLWALENREAQVFCGKNLQLSHMLTKRNVEGSERFIRHGLRLL